MLAIIGAIIYFLVSFANRHPIFRNWLYSLFLVAGIALIAGGYLLNGDPLNQTLTLASEKLNSKGSRMMDSITRMDGTSITANHTFHYRYTIVSDTPPSGDDIKNYMMSTLKSEYQAHPELQAFRDKGTTFEYDYFAKDGTPITQVVIGPNDLK